MLVLRFKEKKDLLGVFPTEQHCIDYLEKLRWKGMVKSPFDKKSKIYRCKPNTYKCKNTGKYFNVKTGTMFHNTKIDLQKWFLAIWITSQKGNKINSVALGKALDITQKTAWFMIQRIQAYRQNQKSIFEYKNRQDSKRRESDKVISEKEHPVLEKDKLPLIEWLQLFKKQQ